MNPFSFPSPRLNDVKRPLAALVLVATLLPIAQATSETKTAAPTANVVRVTADQQLYDMEKQKYLLKGNVKAYYQNVLIQGSEAVMDMDTAGKPSVARFINRPQIKRKEPLGEDTIVGDRIQIYLKDNSFGAEGNVHSYITTVAADPFTIRSDVQQFDNQNKLVTATGSVSVDYKDTKAFSSQAFVRIKDDGKADRVVFSGGARVKKNDTEIIGSKITVLVDSGNLIAEQGVRTRVDLKPQGGAGPTRVLVNSDYQQYDKNSDKMLASGNVRIVFGDYIATGPKATFTLKNGGLDKMFLTGRSTIIEPGRQITADKITISTNPKNFDAVGNVKVQFQKTPPASAAKPASKPAAGKSAGKPAAGATSGGEKPASRPDDFLDY